MDAVTAARAVLPGWIPWVAPVLYVLLAATLTPLLTGAWAAHATKRARPERFGHWTEGSAAAWDARRSTLMVGLVCVLAAAIFPVIGGGPLAVVGPGAVGIAGAVLAMAWVSTLRARQEIALHPRPVTPGEVRRGSLSRTVAALGHLLVTAAVALAVPAEPLWGLAGVLLCAVVTWGWVRGAGVQLCLLLGLAKPADPRLQAIVARAQARLAEQGVRAEVRRTDVLAWHMANAFAFPAGKRLAFTRGAVDHLDDEVLEAITAHELGHIAEPPAVVRARTLAAMSFAPLAMGKTVVAVGGPLAMGALVLGVLVVLMAGTRLARRMEERADAHGHDHAGENPEAYARALEEIYALNRVPPVLGGGRSHPDLIDRMRAAGVEPEWPVPEPPRARAGLLPGLAALLAWAVLIGGLRIGGLLLMGPLWMVSPTAGMAVAATWGFDDWSLEWARDDLIAALLYDEARLVNDLILWEYPERTEPWLAEIALAGAVGDCEHAEQVLAAVRIDRGAVVDQWWSWPEEPMPWMCAGADPRPAVPTWEDTGVADESPPPPR